MAGSDLTPLLAKWRKIAEQRTPSEYWQKSTSKIGQVFGLWYRHFAEGPHTNREQAERDAAFIVLSSRILDALLDVAEAAETLRIKHGWHADMHTEHMAVQKALARLAEVGK